MNAAKTVTDEPRQTPHDDDTKVKARKHRSRDSLAGWLFTGPMLVILGLFLVVPVLMALWVSFSDWSGRGSPFSSGVSWLIAIRSVGGV